MYKLVNANKTATEGNDEYFEGSYWQNENGNIIKNEDVEWVLEDSIKTKDGKFYDVERWR